MAPDCAVAREERASAPSGLRAATSRRLDVGDLVEAGLRFLDQLAETRPLLAELGRVVGGLELLAVGPLHVVHEVAAVLALVQADRHEAGLLRHEAGPLL